MKLVLETDGLPVDAWLRDYLRTTVGFAVWHYEGAAPMVHVRLDRALDPDGSLYVRCGLRAATGTGGSVFAGATGREVTAAVQKAADLLEVALHRTPARPPRRAPARLAA